MANQFPLDTRIHDRMDLCNMSQTAVGTMVLSTLCFRTGLCELCFIIDDENVGRKMGDTTHQLFPQRIASSSHPRLIPLEKGSIAPFSAFDHMTDMIITVSSWAFVLAAILDGTGGRVWCD